MGHIPEITDTKYPTQGEALHCRARVVFYDDFQEEFFGTIIRDDITPPGRTIIALDDGRVVLGTECVYSFYTKIK